MSDTETDTRLKKDNMITAALDSLIQKQPLEGLLRNVRSFNPIWKHRSIDSTLSVSFNLILVLWTELLSFRYLCFRFKSNKDLLHTKVISCVSCTCTKSYIKRPSSGRKDIAFTEGEILKWNYSLFPECYFKLTIAIPGIVQSVFTEFIHFLWTLLCF